MRGLFVVAVTLSLALYVSAEVFDEPRTEDILSAYEPVEMLPEEDAEFVQLLKKKANKKHAATTTPHQKARKARGRFKFRFKPASPGQGHVGPYPASTSGSSKPFEANAIAYDKVAKAAHHVALTKAMEAAAMKKAKAIMEKEEATKKVSSAQASVQRAMNVAAVSVRKFKGATSSEVAAKNKIKAEKAFVHKRRAQAKAAHAAAAAADSRLRAANQDLVKAQQKEFSSKLTAESRGLDYQKKQADAIKKRTEFAKYEQRQKIIHALTKSMVSAGNQAAAAAAPKPAPKPAAKAAPKPAAKPTHKHAKKAKAAKKAAKKKVKKKAAKKAKAAKKKAAKKAGKKVSCKNSKKFPKKYAQAGGGPQDCAVWAKAGNCTHAKFRKFMRAYCAKSCGCPGVAKSKKAILMPVPGKL